MSLPVRALAAALLALLVASPAAGGPKSWLREARIAATDLWLEMTDKELRAAIDELAEQGVNTFDIDFSYLPIERQVEMVERILGYARGAFPRMRFFVYQAPLEVVSERVDRDRDGEVDPGRTSMFSDHPDWAQQGLGGEPAVVYGADAEAFWVGPEDEDLWLCPNDPEYRQRWSDEISRLAATGVDGIYVDVPFLRGWFDERRGWHWACACSDCADIYRTRYGDDLPTREDWGDPNFRRFVRFRFEQVENFVAELRRVVRKANRKTRLIIEHWDGLGDSAETACDPALIAHHSDVRCHEWTNADGSSSDYGSYAWLEDAVRYLYYRAVDGRQPTWVLAYTDEGDADRMRALAALQLTAGCNFWETDAPDMDGSVDTEARSELFAWIASNSKLYYRKKMELLAEVGLLHSRDSIVFHDYRRRREPWRCAREFLGLGIMLLQSHVPFRVVTPGDLDSLGGLTTLVLPNVACVSGAEAQAVEDFVRAGGTVVSTGDTGEYDEEGEARGGSVLAGLFGGSDPGLGVSVRSFGSGTVVVTGRRFGDEFYAAASPARRKPKARAKAEGLLNAFENQVWSRVPVEPLLTTDADPFTILMPYGRGASLQVRIFRIDSIGGGSGSSNVAIGLRPPSGVPTAASYLPFLGQDETALQIGESGGVYSVVATVALHGIFIFRLGR